MGDRVGSPLEGKRVVITRAEAQSGELMESLSSRGAIPILLPLVEFAPPKDYVSLDAALTNIEKHDWLLFTSVNAVQAVATRQVKLGLATNPLRNGPEVAAVGPATQRVADELGFRVAYVAKNHLGVALAEELGERLAGARVFLPRSDRANPDLPAALRRLGAKVTEVVAYRTVCPAGIDGREVAQLAGGQADALLFFSPTAVRNFSELLRGEVQGKFEIRAALAVVGPVTFGALSDTELCQRTNAPPIVASDTTPAAIVDALELHFATQRQRSPAGAKNA